MNVAPHMKKNWLKENEKKACDHVDKKGRWRKR